MYLYVYDGPVMKFNVCIASRWKGSTRATSEKKARRNLAYQCKKECNVTSSAKLYLQGEITLINNEIT